MLRRFAALTIAFLYLCSMSCSYYSTAHVRPNEADGHIIAITMTSGEVIEFDKTGGSLTPGGKEIFGMTKSGRMVIVPSADVASAVVRRFDSGELAATVVFVGVIVILFTGFGLFDGFSLHEVQRPP